MNNIKYDWDDITIVPAELSEIDSRSEVNINKNEKLPIFVSPMDTVIDENNCGLFYKLGMEVCLPRHLKYLDIDNPDYFYSYGLDEIIEIVEGGGDLPPKVLIDIANGNMKKLYNISIEIKDKYDTVLMVGNIANPETYRKYCEIGIDYIRCNIGSGSACTTAANVGIFYPSASLIEECYDISKEFDRPTKIIVDGGLKNFSDITKALAIGGDYVMLGNILNKAFESCSPFYHKLSGSYQEISLTTAEVLYERGETLFKRYRGMSTKEVQKKWGRKELRTSEGIAFYNEVEYTLEGWIENFSDYLRSAMSYTNSRTLDEFKNSQIVRVSENSYKRYNK